MIHNEIQQRLQLFIYIIQSLKVENKTQQEIINSFYDYGMNQKDFENLWKFYLSLERQWKGAIKKLLENNGIMSYEIQCQLEGISKPFFYLLYKKEMQKQRKNLLKKAYNFFAKKLY